MKRIGILTLGLMMILNLGFAQNTRKQAEIDLDDQVEDLYTSANMAQYNINKNVLRDALKGYNKIQHTKTILAIADLNKSSKEERLYVIDVEKKQVLFNTLVAHGKNSGAEYATSFSNEKGSLQTSLGFYLTGVTITSPKHGYAMLLHGQEEGINHNALHRQVIVHSADYVSESYVKKNGRLGRSWGCPALPKNMNKQVVDVIKDGAVLYIAGRDDEYPKKSKYLN
jgi:hypothetical protein